VVFARGNHKIKGNIFLEIPRKKCLKYGIKWDIIINRNFREVVPKGEKHYEKGIWPAL
jgi:hypothetical protein